MDTVYPGETYEEKYAGRTNKKLTCPNCPPGAPGHTKYQYKQKALEENEFTTIVLCKENLEGNGTKS